jgi:protein-tyrosine-phosphatase
MAEAILSKLIRDHNISQYFARIEFCGIHASPGDATDPRTTEVLTSYGITIQHEPREFVPTYFLEFDFIFAMDHINLAELEARKRQLDWGNMRAKVWLLER